MAAGSSPSDQSAALLKKLSLDAQTNAVEVPAPALKGFYGDNGTFTPQHGYGYASYGTYHYPHSVSTPTIGHDSQLNGTEQYQYPGHIYQPPAPSSMLHSSNQSIPFQGEVANSATAEKVPLSVGTAAGNPSGMSNTGSVNKTGAPKPFRPRNNSSSANLNGSYAWGGLQTGYYSSAYQDPRFSFDGYQSPIPWLDASQFANGTSRYTNGSGFSSQLNSHPTRPSSGFGQSSGYVNMMYPNSRMYGQYGNRGGAYNSWTNGRGWVVVDNKYKSRGRGYANENVDGLSELNKGPRGNGLKNQKDFGAVTRSGEEQNLPLTKKDNDDDLHQVVDKEQFNREDLPEDYSVAKFFVIKSYSEDDVHRSIKYNVWTSTPNGNKKLDAAYQEAEKNSGHCPVFLLFSVNTSGQFVGLAEMVGPVDFEKTVEYWQQDKWNGCFPVKWHIIKDVPNSCLRHITLENNENKPVTNSRDTQEVNLEKGVEILKILKGYKNKTSILDDFEFYAHRERIMQEKRAKQKIQKQVSEGRSGNDINVDQEKVPEVNNGSPQEPMTNGHVKPSEDNKSDATQMKSSPKDSNKVVTNVVASAC